MARLQRIAAAYGIISIAYRLHGEAINGVSFEQLFKAGLITVHKRIEDSTVVYFARLKSRHHGQWIEQETLIPHLKALLLDPIAPAGVARALRSLLGLLIIRYGEEV